MQANWVFNPNSGKCEDSSGLVTSCQDNSGNSFEGRNLCQAYCVSKAVQASARSLQTGESRVTLPARAERVNEESRVTLPAKVEQVDEADPCLMDKVVGRCRAALRRFYFDKTSGTCKGFFYGGCGGNANNFASKVECEAKCHEHLQEDEHASDLPSICSEPAERGPCKAAKRRFYYNTQNQRCERFLYGGCQGNENNFLSLPQCARTCGENRERSGPILTTGPVIFPDETCTFNGQIFNAGDILKMTGDRCTTCICSTPPDLTCQDECP